MKDDRARPQRIMCAWAFFFFFFPANTQALKRSDTVQGRITLRFRRGCCCGLTRCRAPRCLSGFRCLPILGSVSLANMTPVSDAFSWVPTAFCRRLTGCPHWAPSTSPSGNFPQPQGQMPEDFPSMRDRDRSPGIIAWVTGRASKKLEDKFPSFLLGQTAPRSSCWHGL